MLIFFNPAFFNSGRIALKCFVEVTPGTDITGIPSSATASYNLNSLNITPETKGIKLQLNSEEKGEVEVVFEQKDFNKSAVKMEEMDLSKMQLPKENKKQTTMMKIHVKNINSR